MVKDFYILYSSFLNTPLEPFKFSKRLKSHYNSEEEPKEFYNIGEQYNGNNINDVYDSDRSTEKKNQFVVLQFLMLRFLVC